MIAVDDKISIQNALREKWRELPGTRLGRVYSDDALGFSDTGLLTYWEECRRQTSTPGVRGWFQNLYADVFDGLEVADIGPGIGIDGIFFAEHGAKVTFVDIVEGNLNLLKRICALKGIDADFYFIDNFHNFTFSRTFDVFLAVGSLINAPFDFMQKQMASMTQFLRVGGRMTMLAYPKQRYDASGATTFEEFGRSTDGERTPWVEWYDDDKVRRLLGPDFKLNWSRNFGQDDIEFNWFDLTKTGETVLGHKQNVPSSGIGDSSHAFENAEAAVAQGELFAGQGKLKEALKAFSVAYSLNPMVAKPLNNRGVLLWQSGDKAAAVEALTKALKIEPLNEDAAFNAVHVLLQQKEVHRAKSIYDEHLEAGAPYNPDICEALATAALETPTSISMEDGTTFRVDVCSVLELQTFLAEEAPPQLNPDALIKPFSKWETADDDGPIFRYLYRHLRPHRHLEFGTWQGDGVLMCLEESDAVVWTINLLDGERNDSDENVYGFYPDELPEAEQWAARIGLPRRDNYNSDVLGFVGWRFLKRNLGHRVCQSFCDSRDWDSSKFPEGFFDTALIDGGHDSATVVSDSTKAASLVRSGGFVMWHDFCPPLYGQDKNVTGVLNGIASMKSIITESFERLVWIYPSMILLGVKR